ncbi:ORF25 [Betabaculovirus altermyunipunctae]|uniref:ORF25 n=1 Tax=Betabaculovirus altermyunipunctae TaxID=3051996 RepID=A0A1S5YDW8_9BBAC|nr:ORF25 [Betabaculovirus altermyunipunctae]AQQ80292.1 ORF25 [Betabaculovirus altermyunipunctae]
MCVCVVTRPYLRRYLQSYLCMCAHVCYLISHLFSRRKKFKVVNDGARLYTVQTMMGKLCAVCTKHVTIRVHVNSGIFSSRKNLN